MARTANKNGSETCEWCDDGLAVTGVRDGWMDEYGPCPWCELGAEKEFPTKQRPHWGKDGYWRGRPAVVARSLGAGVPLSHAENKRRVRLLMFRSGAIGADVDPAAGVELLTEKERLSAVAAEEARLPA